MPKFGEISWESKDKNKDTGNQVPSISSFDSFMKYCQSKLPKNNLEKSCQLFSTEKQQLDEKFREAIETISNQPFATAFLLWIKEVALSKAELLNKSQILLDNGFIGMLDKEGRAWTIGDAKYFDHTTILDSIRCRKDWTLQLREELICCYIEFINWLHGSTYGYISKLEDPDLLQVQQRSIPYHLFITFLNELNEKAQLVAKLLYFGGSRTIEEVLSLNLEDIDFNKKLIRFKESLVSYPLHIFADIKSITSPRKNGRVFIGRQNADLSATTIFRNFKEAAIFVGLGTAFSASHLTINK